MTPRTPLALLLLCLAPGVALAHPHVFIDAGLDVHLDGQNRVTAVRVTWSYDDFYSLVTIQDRDMDRDGDGRLTEAELDELARTDVDWDEGFPGDILLESGGGEVALDRPTAFTARYEDGRLITSHLRALSVPVDVSARPLIARIFDPTFFVAYDVTLPITVDKAPGCAIARVPADLDAAYTLVEELLYGPQSQTYGEDDYPEVGAAFADTLTIACAG